MTTPRREDPLLTGARREMRVAIGIWAVALLWTVGVSVGMGYGRAPDSLTFVLGFPDWIFWGVVVPWLACTLVSTWFAFGFMTDAPLDDSPAESPADSPADSSR